MIKAISFDMWGTLIKSNPNARQERVSWLQQFGKEYLSNQEIRSVMSSIKSEITDKVERYGVHYDNITVHQMILNRLNIDEIIAPQFVVKSNQVFHENRPTLIPGTIETLFALSEKYKLYIASNTLMMNGSEFRKMFRDLQMDVLFDKMIFSDELTVAKPNPRFYKAVEEASGLMAEEILHVGDNSITDVRGPSEYGFKTLLVTNGITGVPKFINTLNQINQ